MTDTAYSPTDDAVAPGSQVQSLTFLATDEELLLLLQGKRGALHKLYPEGEEELTRAVEQAVKRSLVARRAVVLDDDTGRLEFLQPWAGLVETLATGDRFCRITVDGDDRSARLVLVGEDALFTIERDPTGVHTVTISVPDLATEMTAAFLLEDRDDEIDLDEPAGQATAFTALRLTPDALADGRAALQDGDEDRAARLLGASTELLRQVTRTVRVETMELTDGVVHGAEFDVLDAGPLGWAHVVYAGDDTPDVILTPLTDDALVARLAEVLTS